MLKITDLHKTFLKGTPNAHHALRGINLTLNDGDFVTVIGSNGAGKSTLFNAIAGSFLCDSGSIVLDGQNITFVKEHRRAKQISRMFQDPMLGTAPDLTIQENMALAYSKSVKGMLSWALSKQDAQLFRETLAQLNMGIEDRMKTKMGQLSGGQRQAVALMMATLVTPRLLLLDEHTAALDPVTAEKVLDITRDVVAKHSITTMMITHNIASALSMGNRTIMMEQGQIVLDLSGPERDNLDVPGLLELYRQRCNRELDNDRMLLNHDN